MSQQTMGNMMTNDIDIRDAIERSGGKITVVTLPSLQADGQQEVKKDNSGNGFSLLHPGMIVNFGAPQKLKVQRHRNYMIVQQGTSASGPWFKIQVNAKLVTRTFDAEIWENERGHIPDQRWKTFMSKQ
ncbi:hypothetical protein [Acetobacter malorum]|nr:hypothetical protein [Acetobacter malorum]KXV05737.1 hypothetical protein AD930_11440 [Acetobacter malorum]